MDPFEEIALLMVITFSIDIANGEYFVPFDTWEDNKAAFLEAKAMGKSLTS